MGGPGWGLGGLACSASAPSFSSRQARAVARSVPLGSAAGPSSLAPRHVADACAFAGSLVADALSVFCTRVAQGKVPETWRPFFFGARSMALEKKDGGLRPLAAGETLRRITGKLLARHVSRDIGVWFVKRHQVAVAVAGGADAAALALRLFASSAAHSRSAPRVVVKVDMSNAFNSVSRVAVIDGAVKITSSLAPYFACAYGLPSHLFFGRHVIVSATGVHQGDPLGPCGFSIGLNGGRTMAARELAALASTIAGRPPSTACTLPASALASQAPPLAGRRS